MINNSNNTSFGVRMLSWSVFKTCDNPNPPLRFVHSCCNQIGDYTVTVKILHCLYLVLLLLLVLNLEYNNLNNNNLN